MLKIINNIYKLKNYKSIFIKTSVMDLIALNNKSKIKNCDKLKNYSETLNCIYFK